MIPAAIPPGTPIRVVGDVHGDATAFAYAAATDRFVVQLGDLTDHGPDSAGTHDLKLARVLAGHARMEPTVRATIDQLDNALRDRVQTEVARAPGWLLHGTDLLVHGGFHPVMLTVPPPEHGLDRAYGPLARALFGEPTGRTQRDGYPERSLKWVDHIPPGITVYCGHDRRSGNGRPYVKRGGAGGSAVFLDTGAGKGGHLSWIDL